MRQPDRFRAGSADHDRVTDASRLEPGLVGELRDTELAISLWRQKVSEFDGVPPPTAFDFSSIIGGAWNHRFVICTDAVVGELTFLIYGSRFAQLLELPAEPISGIPIARQLPGRYLSLFIEGCREAVAQAAPVRLSGAVVDYGQIELYRAAFMPLAMREDSFMRLVFGSFNRRIGQEAHSTDAVRSTYNSIFEDIQLGKARASSSERPTPASSADGSGC